jgi:hypothetical protein
MPASSDFVYARTGNGFSSSFIIGGCLRLEMLVGLLYKGKEKRGEKQGALAEKSPIFHVGRSFEKASHWLNA